MSEAPYVHATAVVDAGAHLAPGSKIWHFCHVMPGARIGAGAVLGQNVFVASGVVVGAGSRVQNNVSLYEGVSLAERVFVGPSAVFTNVRHPRAGFPRKDRFEETRVERDATIGANATIRCGVTLGEGAFVAAAALVLEDVPPFRLVAGVPARPRGWVCRCGEHLPESLICSHCGRRYARAGEEAAGLRPVDETPTEGTP